MESKYKDGMPFSGITIKYKGGCLEYDCIPQLSEVFELFQYHHKNNYVYHAHKSTKTTLYLNGYPICDYKETYEERE